ncbi:MAG: hypothetical protein HOK75_01230, partial [Phycisphaerae bacterium]|nr:hypothetical protein [Phycisphaerae bacterium]
GAGNLLGEEQSGHIAAVGYEMYCQLLEQAVLQLREGKKPVLVEAMVDLGVSGVIPNAYIASMGRRLVMYCRFASCETMHAVQQIVRDMETGYGDLPAGVKRLVQYHELRVSASMLQIGSMIIDDEDVVIRTKDSKKLAQKLQRSRGTLRPVGVPSATGFTALYFRSEHSDEFASKAEEMHSYLVKSSCL